MVHTCTILISQVLGLCCRKSGILAMYLAKSSTVFAAILPQREVNFSVFSLCRAHRSSQNTL